MSRAPLGVCLLLAATAACSRAEPALDRPSIVVISIDTLRADRLGAYGEKRATSPAFDAFARDAVVFERCWSQAGLTAPSHMTLLTSLYPSVHQVSNRTAERSAKPDDPRGFPRKLDPKVATLASTLRAAGWRTGAFVSGGNLNRECGFDQGFETFDQEDSDGMNGNRESPFDCSVAQRWLAEHEREPFFLFLHTYIPHAPYVPPPPWNREFGPAYAGRIPSDREAFFRQPAASNAERSLRFWSAVDRNDPRDVAQLEALYAGDVRYADDALARMLAMLRSAGVLERSIVVVLSDHGEEFLEHGEFEHPHDIYGELVHVPLAIQVPGVAPRRVAQPVRLIDVMPTLLELAHVPAPPALQGVSIAPLLTGEGIERPAISEAILAWRTPPAGGAWQPLEWIRTLRTGGWTYLERTNGQQRKEELYDLRADPGEQRDVASDPAHGARLASYRALLAAHDEVCRRLADGLAGKEPAPMSEETRRELGALGYVDK